MSAGVLWERVLTEADRQKLGGDIESAYRKHGTIGMWMNERGVSKERATLDIAHAINLLSENDYQWLLREIGETAKKRSSDRPRWAAAEGSLYLGEERIRRVKRHRNPSNIELILDAFEAANWVSTIQCPLARITFALHTDITTVDVDGLGIASPKEAEDASLFH